MCCGWFQTTAQLICAPAEFCSGAPLMCSHTLGLVTHTHPFTIERDWTTDTCSLQLEKSPPSFQSFFKYPSRYFARFCSLRVRQSTDFWQLPRRNGRGESNIKLRTPNPSYRLNTSPYQREAIFKQKTYTMKFNLALVGLVAAFDGQKKYDHLRKVAPEELFGYSAT